MRSSVIVMTACLLLSLPAQGATILSFSDDAVTQTVTANDQQELLSSILSQISFVAGAPQDFSQGQGFPVSIFVAVDSEPPSQVPEPSSFLLSCLGLLGLGFLGRRRSV